MCSGAEGQLLIFHLPNTDIRLKKDNVCMILKRAKNQSGSLYVEHNNKTEIFRNGTIKLGSAMKTHSGEYTLEEFGSNGAFVKKVQMHLEIYGKFKKIITQNKTKNDNRKNSLWYRLCI